MQCPQVLLGPCPSRPAQLHVPQHCHCHGPVGDSRGGVMEPGGGCSSEGCAQMEGMERWGGEPGSELSGA